MVNPGFIQHDFPLLPTCLWDINPNVVFVEGISICVESAQLIISLVNLADPIHGSILLMSKHNPIARLTIARTFSTLAADWLVFIALKLPGAAGLAVGSGRHQQLFFQAVHTRTA